MKKCYEVMTREELEASFDVALEQIKRGECLTMEEVEELMAKEFGDELPADMDAIRADRPA